MNNLQLAVDAGVDTARLIRLGIYKAVTAALTVHSSNNLLLIVMEILPPQQIQIQFFPPNPQHLMTAAVHSKLSRPLLLRFTGTAFKQFSTVSSAAAPATITIEPEVETVPEPSTPGTVPNGTRRESGRVKKVGLDANQLKLNWLKSLSCPLADNCENRALEDFGSGGVDPGWVIGVDPDLSGALAVLRPDNSVQVFDSPHLKVMVGRKVRKRLDVRSIIELLHTVDVPVGTTVYLEQSIPYPQDGKQGWWSGGFGYGLWIGILVASGYSVVPVPSFLWKTEFKLSGSRSGKDDSRELASTLFPTLSSSLKRKKDHGRAEALLIAAYGKGLKVNNNSPQILDNLIP